MDESQLKFLADVTALATVLSTLVGWLPPIAAIVSIVWTGIQIYEWNNRRKEK